MRELKIFTFVFVTLIFISACGGSAPVKPVDNSAAAEKAKAKAAASHQEMDRGFDPCEMNSKLAVCKE